MKNLVQRLGINSHSLLVCIRIVILSVFLYGSVGCSGIVPDRTSTSTVVPSPSPTPDAVMEEERVFAALVKALYSSSSILVIMDQTQTSVLGLADETTYQHVEGSLKHLSADTMQNFRSNNAASQTLRASMVLSVQYILFSQKDRQDLFQINQSGWDIFYNRYPDAPGIITFSKVGFNKTLDQALVYLGIQSNWLAGAGNFYLLKKVEGIWVIDEQVMSWIS
jgi:hypothetical protein